MTYICEFCNKIFTTNSNLLKHKQKTKYCLKIQNNRIEIEKTDKEELVRKYEDIINQLNIDKEELVIKNQKLVIKNQELVNELEQYKQTIKEELINELQEYKQTIKEIAMQPKNISNTNTNNINIIANFDMNEKYFTEKIKEFYNINHLMLGQKGVANFVAEHLLKDENGKLLYYCSDSSRNIYKYKDINGEIIKDCQAHKLITTMKPGLIEKTPELHQELNIKNPDQYKENMINMVNIYNLEENNSEFNKQLTKLTSN